MEKIYQHILNSIPESVDFNFISVKNESTRTITLNNISDVSVYFTIEHTPEYKFELDRGVVTKNQNLEIKIKIKPEEASVIVSNAKITLDNKTSKVIKLSSIAKYPYLTLPKDALDFGIVPIGKSSEQDLVLTNTEAVPAKFTITRQSTQPGKHPEVFYLSTLTGEVPPNTCFLIKIKYKTVFPGLSSHENYLIKTAGGNQLHFSCSGMSSSLKTWLGAKYVNFKSIPLGTQNTKRIRIYNDSDQPTEYQMYYMNNGAFIINKTQGLIPSKSNMRINITFRPFETIVYYERVFCLMKSHFLTVIDLYGSSHDLLTKPRILEQKNIDIFRFKLLHGFYFDRPFYGGDSDILDKLNRTINKSSSEEKTSEDALIAFTNQTQLHKEMFWEQTSPNRIVSCDVEHIDFSFVEEQNTSEPFIVHVQNNSNEKVKVKWVFNKQVNLSNLIQDANALNAPNTIFFVQPEESIINKKGQGEFKVYFKPSKQEYYFFNDMTCQATLLTNYNSNANPNATANTSRNQGVIQPINSTKLTQTGLEMANMTQSVNLKRSFKKTKTTLQYKNTELIKSLNAKPKLYEYFDPPIPLKLTMVGHSFPPGTQIFMPIYTMTPKRELFFPSVTINQSTYQTIKIENNSDTPLFYKFSTDPLGIFRIHRKNGLIDAKEFHLICVEFCPKDCTVYRFPLRIIFNHDSVNMKTLILNGLCTDPVIEIEGVKNDIYFPPSYIGIKTNKTLRIKNLSPIKMYIQISLEKNPNAIIEVQPSFFEMEPNVIKHIEIELIPTKTEEIMCPVTFNVERIYDPLSESIGIFNPGSFSLKTQALEQDKRCFRKEIRLLGRGADGYLNISPLLLDFGTVKVGFYKKMQFVVSNPTMTNFYIKIFPEIDEDIIKRSSMNKLMNTLNKKDKEKQDVITFDFHEGFINSLCQKEINVTFHPKVRSSLNVNVYIYSSHNLTIMNKPGAKSPRKGRDIVTKANVNAEEFDTKQELKCQLRIKANGDYPLIKIVDLRNIITGTCTLWKNFNVNEANLELQEKLSSEELSYMANDMTSKKSQEYQEKLKCIKCDFGKHLLKSSIDKKSIKQSYDVYMTLKNEGGVTSEFYFKFPDDIAIKREIWMDPVEPTSADEIEYHVIKEHIFEIEPRKSKLEPNECCNIRFRYNIKEKGEHRLKVIFQIINGKPLIFELNAESYLEKAGVLEIQKPILNFSYIPIGCMTHVGSSIELTNVGGSKIKYHVSSEEIEKFNMKNENVNVISVENLDGILGPGDIKYLLVYFRPISHQDYELKLIVYYTDDTSVYQIPIVIKGSGYHPYKFTPSKRVSAYIGMPHYCLWNQFHGEMIQKCGTNIQEIDFGEMSDKPVNKTLILYNYSMTNSFTYDFPEPGFLLQDELKITPNKGVIEPNSHRYIKMCLTPRKLITLYEGEMGIKILWNSSSSIKDSEKEILYIRIVKHTLIKDSPGMIEMTNNVNCSFIENILMDFAKEIFCSKTFDTLLTENIDNQPLGLYDWTNDIKYPEHKDVRKKMLTNYSKKGDALANEHQIVASLRKPPTRGTIHVETPIQNLGEAEDLELQEKYSFELMNKFKMTIPEMNEKIIMLNQESRNVISNIIMENTIFNILSEAVYGEINLTEKVRIYFFANKMQSSQMIAQSQQSPINRIQSDSDYEKEDKDKDKDKDKVKERESDKENMRYVKLPI